MNAIHQQLTILKQESTQLIRLSDEQRNLVLLDLADSLDKYQAEILIANQIDLDKMPATDPKYDRLKLTSERIRSIANDVRKVVTLSSPLERVLEHKILANGLDLQKISVPLGVVAVIYEARPNVTIDVFSLCFKSGNAIVLKGGSEAFESNKIFVKLIQASLSKYKLNSNLVYLMPANREAVYDLLNAVGLVDVCIPRGSQSLIEFVRTNAKIPVIETGAGIVHTYFDGSGDVDSAIKIIDNAKTRRVSVCNALDCLLVARQRINDLSHLVAPLATKKVIIYADSESYAQLAGFYPTELLKVADSNSFGCEFLDYKLAIKIVADVDEAIQHIRKYTSGHSEAIIATDAFIIEEFINQVDAAVVYVNASTAFTDGGEFGMGAEIGISTQKLHARGPMALPELTSYKWVVRGNGQTR